MSKEVPRAMDPAYEFQAPQFVDFNNIGENDDNAVDEFFNVDMESREEWTTAVSTLEDDDDHMECGDVADRPQQDATFQVTAPVRIPPKVSQYLLVKNNPPSSSLHIPRKPGKPSNMVTSWGSGQVTKTSGKGHLNNTNCQDPRLAAARPRSQIQRSLNTPTASSRARRRSKSPNIPIPFPKTLEVVTRFKKTMVGEDMAQNQPSKQPFTKFRSQAEQIISFQRSTPSRFRSRPYQPPKPSSLPQRQLRLVPAGKDLESILLPKMKNNTRSIPNKGNMVESLAESAKTFGFHQRRLPSTDTLRDSTTRPSITVPAPFKFTTQVRAGEREKFEAFKRKKECAAEDRKRIEDKKQAKENEEALVHARKALVHKAQPIRNFKPLKIKRSDKKLTMPFSPNFGLLKGLNCSR